MSEFNCVVVEVNKIGKHPNADTLSLTQVMGGYTTIFRTGDFNTGDLACYIPIDAVLPNTPEYEFLGSSRRVKAKKLRGIFSNGLLLKAPPGVKLGDNVQQLLGITKYEPPLDFKTSGENEQDPGFIPVYTDIEGLRKYKNFFTQEDKILAHEKLHGTNSRYAFSKDRLWCGSHTKIKKDTPGCIWWDVAKQENLQEKLVKYPDYIFYGEIYGHVQKGYRYDAIATSHKFRVFDIFSIETGRYLEQDDMFDICTKLGLQVVPLIYSGKYLFESLEVLANGRSTLSEHTIREGLVVRPVKNRWDPEIGRVIFKLPGEDYLIDRGKR